MDSLQVTEADAIDAIRERSSLRPWLFGYIIGECIEEYMDMRSAGLIPEPRVTQPHQPPHDSHLLSMFSFDAAPVPDSGLATRDSLASILSSDPVPSQGSALVTRDSRESMFSPDAVPARDSGLETRDSKPTRDS